MTESIVDIYLECGDFHQAVAKSGLSTRAAHLALLRSGVLKIQDKINYGSRNARRGARAEKLFQQYVPDAIDANKYFKKNNPVYDFMVGDLTIDVKYSSLVKGTKTKQWSFRKSKADFICAFLESEQMKGIKDSHILLIPTAFISPELKTTVAVAKSGPIFEDFLIEPEEIQATLKDYAELREEGLF